MSELRRETSVVKSAKDIEVRAAAWLEHCLSEDWSEECKGALDAWVAQSWAHRTAYLRLEAAWTRADRLSALRRPVSEREVDRTGPKSTSGLLKVLAISAFAIVVSVGATVAFLRPSERTYTTAVGAHETIMLADGSRVELNTDSVIRVAQSEHRRVVWLDRGEAFFQIRHDAAHPFVVEVNGHHITDLGTEFIVRRDWDRLRVAVMEGRVRLDIGERTHSHSTLLKRGDVAVAGADSISVTKKSPQKLANELSWRRGILIFDRTTLAAAAAEFNRYNREKLVIADPAAAHLMVYGTFPSGDVKAFTRVAREVFGLHIENLGDESVISR